MGIFKAKEKVSLTVEGMTCGHCEAKVRDALGAVEGVKKVLKVDRSENEAVVSVTDTAKASKDALAQAVTDAGYIVKG